jgi:hypothetical protein
MMLARRRQQEMSQMNGSCECALARCNTHGHTDLTTSDESRPWYWAPDKLAVILAASIMCGINTFLPTRFITRLVLVRRTPTSAAGASASASQKATEILRLQHGGHLMSLSETLPSREVALGDVTVRAIGRPGELAR